MAEEGKELGPGQKYCKNCGSVVSKSAEFCPECGVSFRDAPRRDKAKQEVEVSFGTGVKFGFSFSLGVALFWITVGLIVVFILLSIFGQFFPTYP